MILTTLRLLLDFGAEKRLIVYYDHIIIITEAKMSLRMTWDILSEYISFPLLATYRRGILLLLCFQVKKK